MKLKYTLAALAATSLAANAAVTATKDVAAFDESFTGAEIHDTAGAGYQNGWTGGADDANFDLTTIGNDLNIDTTGDNSSDILTGTATGTGASSWATINAGGSWTIEVNATFNDVANGWAMWLGAQGTDLILVQIENGEINDFSGTVHTTQTINNGSARTVRVAHDASDKTYSAWLDGTEIASEHAYSFNGDESRLLLGDWSGGAFGNDTDVTIHNVAYTAGAFAPVPEPSSAALIGLGGLALIFRRRK